MPDLNRIVVTGTLTSEPELRVIGGGLVCTLYIRVTSPRRLRGGRVAERPNDFEVELWGEQAEHCQRDLDAGSAIGVEGRLERHRWRDEDGRTVEDCIVFAERVCLMSVPAGPSEEDSARSSLTLPF